MKFEEAIKALKECYKIRRKRWPKDRIFRLFDGNVYILETDRDFALRRRPYHEIFTLDDVLAEDWEVEQ